VSNNIGYKPKLDLVRSYDDRDFCFMPKHKVENLPAMVDLRPQFTFECYSQGAEGSCTAHATAAAIQFDHLRVNVLFEPSRQFIYYNSRSLEGNIAKNTGVCLRNVFKTLASDGVCKEEAWPYYASSSDEEGNFPVDSEVVSRPSDAAYVDALLHKITRYEAIEHSENAIKSALASGFPIVFGITVYNGWMNSSPLLTTVPMPSEDDTQDGGHAILLVGYDDATQLFTFRNSWGNTVGDCGHFYLPYEYVLNFNLAFNFFVVYCEVKM
jgi:C1A family cysteine protease